MASWRLLLLLSILELQLGTGFLWLGSQVWDGPKNVVLCPEPCPTSASYSADVKVTRTGVKPSAQDYTAVGKIGITHYWSYGSIVYAADMEVTRQGKKHRAWFAGWNFGPGTPMRYVRRYFLVESEQGKTCVREQDSNFDVDPFSPITARFQRARPIDGPDVWHFVYEHAWSNPDGPGVRSHKANCTAAPDGTVKSMSIHSFENGEMVGTIQSEYSNVSGDPDDAIFWPRNDYKQKPGCDDDANFISNFTIDGDARTNLCIGDILALEYGCM